MKRILIGLQGATLVATATVALLWIFDRPTAAAVVATGTALLWLALIVVVTVAVTSWWTARTMERGAEIALKAQHINDTWDARKTSALAGILKEGARMGRHFGGGQGAAAALAPPALPWEAAAEGEPAPPEAWPPPLAEFGQPIIEADIE